MGSKAAAPQPNFATANAARRGWGLVAAGRGEPRAFLPGLPCCRGSAALPSEWEQSVRRGQPCEPGWPRQGALTSPRACVCGEGAMSGRAVLLSGGKWRESRRESSRCSLYPAPHTVHASRRALKTFIFDRRQPAIGSGTERQLGQPYSWPVTPRDGRSCTHTHTHRHTHTPMQTPTRTKIITALLTVFQDL